MITFPRVPTLSPGDQVKSDHLVSIANGFNTRLRSGLADGPWRIVFYLLSMLRQVRNSDGLFAFPPAAEFFEVYQMLQSTDAIWPVAGPGEAEGANVASILPGYVFGAEGLDLDSEDLRLADENFGGVPLWLGLVIPETPEQIWQLGKMQRGGYDPNTGALAAPAYLAATEHYLLQPAATGPHGTSWGGYMPTPAELGSCADPLFNNYEIFFTNLETGVPRTYAGTCPDEPTHIGALARTPRNYIVLLNDGTLDVLPLSEWIEGPYTGGATVRKTRGDHIHRVINEFVAGYRGTADERATGNWLEHAFDIQTFMTRQYQLAPNKGVQLDPSELYVVYPKFVLTGATSFPIGRPLINQQTGNSTYRYDDGFVLGGALITASELSAPCTIEFLDDGDVIGEATLEPDGSGNVSQIVTFEDPVQPTPLDVRLKTAAAFDSAGGYIDVECSELMEYKPELHDLFLVLRLGSCRLELNSGLDGHGQSTDNAKQISDDYFAHGCIRNIHGVPGPPGSLAEINTNAVFEAARTLSQHVRIMPRRNFVGYEVSGGKSICYFTRYALGSSNDAPIDLFEGIAPSREEITTGGIQAGRSYIVRDTGTVTYNGTEYAIGQTFTGVHGVTEFTGSGRVFEYEGIYANAPRNGFSNEWLMGHQFKGYHPSDSSIWKPDAYSDYWPLSERCQFERLGGATALKYQFDYGGSESVAPEAPTGWRYAMNTNSFPCSGGDTDCEERRRNRYKSCRIYEPDPEIESATVIIEGGQEIVRLQFTGRFHHNPDLAPATVEKEIAYWDRIALAAEATAYRTMENGLREYLVNQAFGAQCTQGSSSDLSGQGNSGRGSPVWGFPDNPFGTCYPHFYFVKLFPKPYVDGNSIQDSWDTPLWADWWRMADLYLKPMVEGYVDQATSVDIGCELGTNALFDYHLESACFEAFGGRWFSTVPTAATEYIEDVRTDGPQGFGQLPNVQMSSEVYNQFASVLNLLTRVRVMLPMQFQTREISGGKTTPVAATGFNGALNPACTASGDTAGVWSGTPPDAHPSTDGGWVDSTGVNASVSAAIDCFSCDGSNWNLISSRVDGEWRWNFTDPDAVHAVPETWRDMVTGAEFGRVLAVRSVTRVEVRASIGTLEESECGQGTGATGHWFDGTNYWKFENTFLEESEACEIMASSGRITASPLGFNDLSIGRELGFTCCGGISNAVGLTPILGNDTMFIEVPLV